MFRALRTVAALTVAVALSIAGCAGAQPGGVRAERPDCIERFDPAVDYFPDKQTVLDAVNFRLDYHRSYQVLTVAQPYAGGKPVSYVLVRCGAPDPVLDGELAHAARISVPVRSMYSASITHLAMIAELGQADVVTGVAEPAAVSEPQIRRRIDAGKVVGYAPGRQINTETVLGADPDVLVTQGTDDPGYPKLQEAGVGVVADAEWLEPTPLGRAEWVKMFAALTGTERRAAGVYDAIRTGYRAVAAKASAATPVEVLAGTMYSGSWFMPTGGGYTGRLIADAGGAYPWLADAGPQSRQLNFESVYTRAGRAPLWLVNSEWASVSDAVAQDSRYAELAAVRSGQVWSTIRAYWERGVARPDLVLGDLVAILHPESAPGHEFAFYRRVPR